MALVHDNACIGDPLMLQFVKGSSPSTSGSGRFVSDMVCSVPPGDVVVLLLLFVFGVLRLLLLLLLL